MSIRGRKSISDSSIPNKGAVSDSTGIIPDGLDESLLVHSAYRWIDHSVGLEGSVFKDTLLMSD
jgi:hypothetical protein